MDAWSIIQVVRNEVHKHGGHGIQLFPDVTDILMLLFADDMVLFTLLSLITFEVLAQTL